MVYVPGKECEDIYRKGGIDSQMYLVQSDPLSPAYKVFCDQTTKFGGQNTCLSDCLSTCQSTCPPASVLTCLSLQDGYSSRTGWMEAWASAVAGTTIAVVSATLPSMWARATARLQVGSSGAQCIVGVLLVSSLY